MSLNNSRFDISNLLSAREKLWHESPGIYSLLSSLPEDHANNPP